MTPFRLPLVLPALAATCGVWSAFHIPYLPVVAVASLLALGLARGGRLGRAVCWACLAAMLTLARSPPATWLAAHDPRPATLLVRIAGHPRLLAGELTAWVQVVRLTRGRETVRLQLSGLLSVPMDRDPAWDLGASLRVRGYLRPAATYENGAPPAGPSWRLRVPSARLVDVATAAPWLGRLAGRLQRQVRALWSVPAVPATAHAESVHRGSVAEAAARPGTLLARALVLGETTALPTAWLSGLRRVGLGHILAVSGLHVGMLTGLALLITPFLPRPFRATLAIVVALVYLAVVGPRPSILRATLMAASAVVAWLLARPPVALNALAGAVLVLVLASPGMIDTLSFRMTVVATVGILTLAPRLAQRCSLLPGVLRLPLAVSLAAQLVTAPLTLPAFAWFAPSAWLANMVAIPWLAVTLSLLGLTTLAGMITEVGQPLLLTLADGCAACVAGLGALPAGPWFGWPWVAPAWVVVGGAGALLALVFGPALVRTTALGCWLLVLAHAAADLDPTFSVLDVGQGDALLLRQGSRAVLIDGGGWPRGDLAGRVLVPALAVRRIAQLDAVVLTHGDRDHCQGLVDVSRYVRIAELWVGAHTLAHPCGQRLAAQVGRVRVLKVGDVLRVGRWRLSTLATGDRPASRGLGDNDRSLVLRAEAHGRVALLTGDIEETGEAKLLAGDRDALVADLLKVAHHGSRTSTGAAWLAATRPRWALVSAGVGNPYGHPADDVVARLLASGAYVLRTDRDGALDIRVQPGGRMRVGASGWRKGGRD